MTIMEIEEINPSSLPPLHFPFHFIPGQAEDFVLLVEGELAGFEAVVIGVPGAFWDAELAPEGFLAEDVLQGLLSSVGVHAY